MDFFVFASAVCDPEFFFCENITPNTLLFSLSELPLDILRYFSDYSTGPCPKVFKVDLDPN